MNKIIFAACILLAVLMIGAGCSNEGDQSEEELDNVEGLQPGNAAPDFNLKLVNGDDISFSDYRGKKVILNMWASWCPACVEELPEFEAFYRDFQAEGIEIIAVNMTESEGNVNNVTQLIEELELTFPVALDEKSITADLYLITTVPTTYLIDSAGTIAKTHIGMLNYEKLKEMISELE